MDPTLFLDEFRPFRRGEVALARKLVADPLFLSPQHADLIRYALRLAQLSAIGPERADLIYPIGSFRLRLLQLLAPVLPTDVERMEASEIYEMLPRVVRLVEDARGYIVDRFAGEKELDDEIATKRLAVVLGGAAGSGYIFLGALRRLEELGITPDYLVGCSIGSILAVVRARETRFDLDSFRQWFGEVRLRGVLRTPRPTTRYGVPAALRLDLRRALGSLFAHPNGEQRSLAELAIPTDTMATGLGPGALVGEREEFAHIVDVPDADAVAHLRPGAIAKLGARLVALAMSRRVLVPLFLGADESTARLAALDAASFSAAIPGLLHADLSPNDEPGAAILDELFARHDLVGIVDGALASVLPASYAWQQIESDRLGSRHCAILALDAVTQAGGANMALAPLLRAINPSVQRDKAFWDLHTPFRRAPPLLELLPSEARLEATAEQGELEFEPTAVLLRTFLAPVRPWSELALAADR